MIFNIITDTNFFFFYIQHIYKEMGSREEKERGINLKKDERTAEGLKKS